MPRRLRRRFAADFEPRAGEDEVDRDGVIRGAEAPSSRRTTCAVDWEGIEQAPNEALVNALSMMSPFAPREKQALLEAPDLKTRAEMLIAHHRDGARARRRRLRRAAIAI